MFSKAIIKLTGFYILIIGLIIGSFSLILFHYTVQHIRDSVEEDSPNTPGQQILAEKTIEDFQRTIIISDLIVILLASLLSYFLAKKTLEPIETALSAQEQFSANASHELRTPLSVMRAENEVFLRARNTSADNAHQLASSNLEEIKKMGSMVENLLILSRSQKIQPSNETKLNISEILNAIIKNLKFSTDVKHLNLVLNKSTLAYIMGNEKLIEQAFTNLIQNAINYTEQGTITINVYTSGHVVVEITDTGIGVSEKDLPHLFEPFYKADKARNDLAGGVGLGLAIVQEIIRKHRGKIDIKSQINKGTTVIVSFPKAV